MKPKTCANAFLIVSSAVQVATLSRMGKSSGDLLFVENGLEGRGQKGGFEY